VGKGTAANKNQIDFNALFKQKYSVVLGMIMHSVVAALAYCLVGAHARLPQSLICLVFIKHILWDK